MWTPSKTLLRSIAKQGPHLDSQAKLYALAIVAYQAGWSTLLVADELAKRELTGNRRIGESSIPSLVMLTAFPRTTCPSRKYEVYVVAVRMSRGVAGDQLLDRVNREDTGENLLDMKHVLDLKKFDNASHRPGQNGKRSSFGPRLNLEHGMILHDPDRPVFEPDTTTLTRKCWFDAAVEALRPLPPELVVSIFEHADSEIASRCLPLKVCPGGDHRCRRHVFFLLYETTSTELRQTRSIIQAAGDKFLDANRTDQRYRRWRFKAEVYALESHGIRTRRDLITFWDYYRDPERNYLLPRLFFVFDRIIDNDIETGQFGMASSDYTVPFVIMRARMDRVITHVDDLPAHHFMMRAPAFDCRDEGALKSKNVESMYHPEQPFWYNPPEWMSADDDSCSFKVIPLFQLTRELTEDEIETIKADLISDIGQDEPRDCKKEVCLVPWRRSQDATNGDIWRIFWEFCKSREETFYVPFVPHDPLFHVDRQSAKDRTVLVVLPDWYPLERNFARHTTYNRHHAQPALCHEKGSLSMDPRDLLLSPSCIEGTVNSLSPFQLDENRFRRC